MDVKTETIRVRTTPDLKQGAEAIFATLGLSASDAINLFYKQVMLHEGLPFEVRIPNRETRKAMREAMARKNLIATDLDAMRREFE
jgi:DNA-damage-inducible protein J